MLSYLFGPFLALLPKRWRESLPFTESVQWGPAVILSGLGESALALIIMMYWYSYSVTHWAKDAVYSALRNGAHIDPNTVGFAALAVMALHPLTWFIAYFGIEGIVRLCATFTNSCLGVLPLFLADKVYVQIFRRGKPDATCAAQFPDSHLSSYIRALLERVSKARLPLVPDELCFTKNGPDEVLEIRACRTKADWIPPRVVRHEDRYYRLEACSRGTAPRPFVYMLRRLSAGVPGRTVLTYSPHQRPVLADR